MRAPARLAVYATVLVAVFASAYVVAGAVVPEQAEDTRDDH